MPQFHTSSIKTSNETKQMVDEFAFQFHTGSIKTNTTKKEKIRIDIVSIPHWFNQNQQTRR